MPAAPADEGTNQTVHYPPEVRLTDHTHDSVDDVFVGGMLDHTRLGDRRGRDAGSERAAAGTERPVVYSATGSDLSGPSSGGSSPTRSAPATASSSLRPRARTSGTLHHSP